MSAQYTVFIALAYGIAGLSLAGAIAALLVDYARLKRALAQLGAPVDEREKTGEPPP